MARFIVGRGLTEYINSLESLGKNTKEICGKAIYNGARIVADEVRKSTKQIPIDNRPFVKNDMLNGISATQKDGLLDSLGVARMKSTGGKMNVKIGWDGYNKVKTERYPKGQPNALIARSVEKGTSFRKKHPFVAPAVRRVKSASENVMKQSIDTSIASIVR